MRLRRWRAALLLVGLLWPAVPASAAHGSGTPLTVAFLYNFALYTEWPALGPAFQLCVAGHDDLGEALEALAAKTIAGRPILLRRLADGDVAADCNLLFIGGSETRGLGALLAPLAARPVLTVAEDGAELALKPMLRLALDQGRLVFDADQGAAQAAGLRFSAKLLRLARSVR